MSEGSFYRLAEAVMFINDYQMVPYIFEFAGPFQPIAGGEGGILPLVANMDVVGISGRLRLTGNSGSTVMDCHYERNGSDQGSIFSTKLTIPNTVSEPGYFWKNLLTTTDDERSGITQPVFSTTEFNAGDQLRFDIDSNAEDAFDLLLALWLRPR